MVNNRVLINGCWAFRTIARRQHLCKVCKETIQIGSIYYRIEVNGSGIRGRIDADAVHGKELMGYFK